MANRLASESSPYLLQHAENPVDWYPWGEEAFEAAREQGKPIFLSVGYSACHWCHVMERESFEDEATAEIMNRDYISIKIDREERPDIDAIYMKAVQAMTGSGGWPMNVFMTPDAVPFYAGMYFPDKSRYGMPSFREVLTQISELWDTRREDVVNAGSELSVAMREYSGGGIGGLPVDLDFHVLDAAVKGIARAYDGTNGGWGGAPKFPQPTVIEFLLRNHLSTGNDHPLEMVTATLDAMAHGGIYDQLGGGFHRYATDSVWLVPHFEKMLYDNAQLARVYLHAWQVTGTPLYRRIVTETLDYVAREMRDPEGGFYAAQDADTEGEEGRFFVWTADEITRGLGGVSADPAGDADLFMKAYGVTPGGNFEGNNILSVVFSPEELAEETGTTAEAVESRLQRSRGTLSGVREARVRPATDDKVLAGWNGLMLAAFAEAARVLDRDDYREIAEKNATFLLSDMRTADGRMLRTWRGGHAKLNGYLEDHANVADGLLELYQTTFDPAWFHAARELSERILGHFMDPGAGFFDTSDDHEELLLRPKEIHDSAMPSGGSSAAGVLLKLAEYTGDTRYSDAAAAALGAVRNEMEQVPLGFSHWLSALDFYLSPTSALVIIGEDPVPMLAPVRAAYRPDTVVAAAHPERDVDIPLLEGRTAIGGVPTAYLCRHFACERPVTSLEDLEALLER